MATQAERMSSLETEVKNTREDVGELKNDVKEMKESLAALPDIILDAGDKRYAPALAGTLIFTFCGLALLAFVGIVFLNPFQQQATPQSITVNQQNPDGTTTTKVVPLSGNSTPASSSTTPTNPNDSKVTVTPNQAPQSSGSTLSKLPVVGGLFK